MKKFKVSCIKHGYAVVEAEDETEALEMAEALPDSAICWESAEDHDVEEE